MWQVFYTLKIKVIIYNCIHWALYNSKVVIPIPPCPVCITFVYSGNRKQFLGCYKSDFTSKYILVWTQNRKLDAQFFLNMTVYLFICNGPHIEKHWTSFILGVTISCTTSHWLLKIKYNTLGMVLLLIWEENRWKKSLRKEDSKLKGGIRVRIPVQ